MNSPDVSVDPQENQPIKIGRMSLPISPLTIRRGAECELVVTISVIDNDYYDATLATWLVDGQVVRTNIILPDELQPGSVKTLWFHSRVQSIEQLTIGEEHSFKVIVSDGPLDEQFQPIPRAMRRDGGLIMPSIDEYEWTLIVTDGECP